MIYCNHRLNVFNSETFNLIEAHVVNSHNFVVYFPNGVENESNLKQNIVSINDFSLFPLKVMTYTPLHK